MNGGVGHYEPASDVRVDCARIALAGLGIERGDDWAGAEDEPHVPRKGRAAGCSCSVCFAMLASAGVLERAGVALAALLVLLEGNPALARVGVVEG